MSRKRSRSNRKDLSHDIYCRLKRAYKLGRGRDRHKDKKSGEDVRFIYATRTYETYREQGKYFAAYAKQKGCKTLAEAKEIVPEYLQMLIDAGKSGFSVRTAASAIGKIYGVNYGAFGVEMPNRKRSEITNNRGNSKMIESGHFAAETVEKYASILRCIGLRRSEALLARGADLMQEDGKYYVWVPRGKGGKYRKAVIQGTDEEIKAVVQLFEEARARAEKGGDGLVWPSGIPRNLPVHRYRAEYAERVYKSVARPVEGLQREEKYICRGDLAGMVYDRAALKYASQQLGHNRVSVVADNYLH